MIVLPINFLPTNDLKTYFGLWVTVTDFPIYPNSDELMDAVFYVSAYNLLMEADCLRLRLANFGPIIASLVELCSDLNGSYAQWRRVTASAAVLY